MKTEIVGREIIKPCSLTLKSYNLCFMDQFSPPLYTKVYLFYQNTCTDDIKEVVAKRSQSLKSSLSEVLTRFYLLAGRIRDKMTVSLEDDDGAEFLETRVDSYLSEYLEKPIQEMFLHFVPDDVWDTGMGPLLMVQANFFKCGGLAIGMNFSHKISDAASFISFINAWADTAIGKPDKIDNPDLSGSLAFPAIKDHFITVEHIPETFETSNKIKRFLFTAEKIAELQENSVNEAVQRATRVAAVSAFLWRIRIKTLMKNAGGSSVSSVLIMPINFRKWLKSPIRDATYGNLVDVLIVPNDRCHIELPYLTSLVREQMEESRKAYQENVDEKLLMERILRNHGKGKEVLYKPDVYNYLVVSSWSKFPLYEADFGWGKPAWVANHNQAPYFVYLMDTRDGAGIEASVSFPDEEMDIFECDEELLTYAIPDPSIL